VEPSAKVYLSQQTAQVVPIVALVVKNASVRYVSLHIAAPSILVPIVGKNQYPKKASSSSKSGLPWRGSKGDGVIVGWIGLALARAAQYE
jgi:hypothetical protein